VTPSEDLAGRIARLERLLDSFARARESAKDAPAPKSEDDIDRLRELTALMAQRLEQPDIDAAERITVRALLEQLRTITADAQRQGEVIRNQLSRVGAALDDARGVLEYLEEDR
jgi:small-conductance mechanosensitive channel